MKTQVGMEGSGDWWDENHYLPAQRNRYAERSGVR